MAELAKKVRVSSADNEAYWYADRIGEEFYVNGWDETDFRVERPEGGFGYVLREDCEVITEPAEPVDSPTDTVDSPSHYTRAKFETIEIIEEITQGYEDGFVGMCVGNALKYLARAPYKHAEPAEDLRKAAKYIEFALRRLERKVDGE